MTRLISFFTSYLQRTSLVMGHNRYRMQSENSNNNNHFNSIDELKSWLAEQNINCSLWGKGTSKSLEDLWHELTRGDSRLQLSPPMRQVHVAQVLIRKDGRVLIESVQEFGSGRRRFRNQVPSEKMKQDEDFLKAATRCLHEELGVAPNQIVFNQATYSEIEVISDSPSYPGLPSQYTFHRIEADVVGLPDSNFWHENVSYLDGDPVKRHFWAWQKFTGNAPGFPS